MKPELTIVIPTYNERDNIRPLIEKIDQTLVNESWSVLFVDDDSTDGTLDTVRAIIKNDSRIELLHRIGRRGLSSACIDGMSASQSTYLAVMDGDLQHDESLLKYMLASLKNENLDLVIGSRYMPGGSVGNWKWSRKTTSLIATWMAKIVSDYHLKDPMSGFFMLRRDFFEQAKPHLHGGGFKILLDLIVSSPREVNFKEIPFTFRNRHSGESKLGAEVVWEYVKFIVDKKIGKK